MKRLRKILLAVVCVLLILLVAGLIALNASLGRVAKVGIETVGRTVLKAPVTVIKVDVRIFRGTAEITGLMVGNPEGFKSESAFKLADVRVSLKPRSVFSNCIEIEEVYIGEPEITYEAGLGGSNIGALQKNVEAFGGGKESTPSPPATPESKGSGKTIRIGDLLVKDGKIRVSATLLGGQGVALPLPEVHLTNLGGQSGEGGKSAGEVVSEVLDAVMKKTVEVVTGAGKLGTDTAKDAAKSVTDGGAKAVKSIKGLFSK